MNRQLREECCIVTRPHPRGRHTNEHKFALSPWDCPKGLSFPCIMAINAYIGGIVFHIAPGTRRNAQERTRWLKKEPTVAMIHTVERRLPTCS